MELSVITSGFVVIVTFLIFKVFLLLSDFNLIKKWS